MPILNFQITNPQAIEFINKVKTGEAFLPLKAWLKRNQWYLLSIFIVFILLLALIFGKKLSESSSAPTFTPPEIESVSPTSVETVQSNFSGLKKEIQNISTDLPDPFIPTFDNNINLDSEL